MLTETYVIKYVLTLNAEKNKVETGITIFTRMQDEVFLLNLALKYKRSSKICLRRAEPDCTKADCSTLYHVQPNQGLHHQIKCKQIRDKSMVKINWYNLLFWDFVHCRIFFKRSVTLWEVGSVCFPANNHLTWWTPCTELISVNGHHRHSNLFRYAPENTSRQRE